MDAILGRAKVLEKQKKYEPALEALSEATVTYKDFLPAYLEKSKIHILSGDWEQALEIIQPVMIADKNNVEALRISVFYFLTRETNNEQTLEIMDDL